MRTAVNALLGLVVGGAGAYAGGVYYALENREFREIFVSRVYGAERAVAQAQRWRDEKALDKLKADAAALRDRVARLGSDTFRAATTSASTFSTTTKGLYEKGKQWTSDLSVKANTFVETAKSASENRKLALGNHKAEPEDQKAASEYHKSAPENHTSASENHKSASADQKSASGDQKSASEDQQYMIAAAKEVTDLNARLAKLKTEHQNATQELVTEQSRKIEQALKEMEKRKQGEIRNMEEHLRDDFALEKAELVLAQSEELKRQLNVQAAKFEAKLRDELASQALALERRWLREVRLHVDRERGGRLARLDQLETRLVALERLADRNTVTLEESVRAHHLRAAVQALRDALSESTRRPFARELTAVRAVAGVDDNDSSEGDSLIRAAATSIPLSTAETGVDTLPDLVARFTVVADQVRNVALVPEDAGGFVPLAISAILSKLMFRKHGFPEGDDIESILARTEFYLREEELDAAARELNQLNGWAKLVASDWLKAARAHLQVKQALELIELQSDAQSLRMS